MVRGEGGQDSQDLEPWQISSLLQALMCLGVIWARKVIQQDGPDRHLQAAVKAFPGLGCEAGRGGPDRGVCPREVSLALACWILGGPLGGPELCVSGQKSGIPELAEP